MKSRLSLSQLIDQDFCVEKEYYPSIDFEKKYYCQFCLKNDTKRHRDYTLGPIYRHVVNKHWKEPYYNTYIAEIVRKYKEIHGKREYEKLVNKTVPETPSPYLKRTRKNKDFKGKDGDRVAKRLKFSFAEVGSQTNMLTLKNGLKLAGYNHISDEVIFFIKNVLGGNETTKLYYSLILATEGQSAMFEAFKKVNVTFSESFCYQKPREVVKINPKKKQEYCIVKYIRDLIFKRVLEDNLYVKAVDNCDVKMPFAVSKKKKIYDENSGRLIFLNGKLAPEIIQIAKNWRKTVNRNLTIELVQKKTFEEYNGRKDLLKKEMTLITKAIIEDNYETIVPFQRNWKGRSHDFKRQEVFKNRESLGEFILWTINQTGIVYLPVEHHACASADDFRKMLKTMDKYLNKQRVEFGVYDEPGFAALHNIMPSILAMMHQEKYLLLSLMKLISKRGFRGFYKSIYKSGKDPETLPHGYLKKVQYGSYNSFIAIVKKLHKLISFYYKKNNSNVIISFIVKCVLNDSHLEKLIPLRSNSSSKRKTDNKKVRFYVKHARISFALVLIKRSVKFRNSELYLAATALGVSTLFEFGHWKYGQRSLQVLYDHDEKWTPVIKRLFSKVFVRKMFYEVVPNGSESETEGETERIANELEVLEECYENWDEKYERSFKTAKSKLSTNPSEKLMFTTMMQNIIEAFKILDNPSSTIYDQEKVTQDLVEQALDINFKVDYSFKTNSVVVSANLQKIKNCLQEFFPKKREVRIETTQNLSIANLTNLNSFKLNRPRRSVRNNLNYRGR